MAIMGFLAVANAYTMRVCLNIAITQMVRRRAATAGLDDGSCPAGEVEQAATGGTEVRLSEVLVLVFKGDEINLI